MSYKKTLVVFDTNTLRNIMDGEPRYDSFKFGGGFDNLIDFINTNNLNKYLNLAITEITLKELIKQKKIRYNKDITDLKKIINRVSHLETVLIPDISLPDKEFDIENYLSPKVESFLKDNKISIIKLKNKDKTKIFSILIEKALELTSPFKDNGKGFKDAIILETLLHDDCLKKYDNFFLITNDDEFNKCITQINNCNKEIITSIAFLIEKIKNLYYHEILENKYNLIISDNYFIQQMKQEIKNEFSCRIKDIILGKKTTKIIDLKTDLWHEFRSDNENEDYFEGMFGCFYLFTIENNSYQIKILYDINANQIEKIKFEEIAND